MDKDILIIRLEMELDKIRIKVSKLDAYTWDYFQQPTINLDYYKACLEQLNALVRYESALMARLTILREQDI